MPHEWSYLFDLSKTRKSDAFSGAGGMVRGGQQHPTLILGLTLSMPRHQCEVGSQGQRRAAMAFQLYKEGGSPLHSLMVCMCLWCPAQAFTIKANSTSLGSSSAPSTSQVLSVDTLPACSLSCSSHRLWPPSGSSRRLRPGATLFWPARSRPPPTSSPTGHPAEQ